MKQTKNILGIGLVLLLLISACAPATTVTPAPTEPPAATATSEPTATSAPTDPTVEPTTASEVPDGAVASGVVTFAIDPDQSQVSYAVDETFINQNNRLNTAVGVTSAVSGELTVDLADPVTASSGQFTVDISTLTTDSSRRDSAIRGQWLESSRFPNATFVITSLSDFPADPQVGQPVTFKMTGDLTIRETARPVTWDVTATYDGSNLTGTATAFLMMADWGVQPPNIINMLIVKDGVTLTLDFNFQQQS